MHAPRAILAACLLAAALSAGEAPIELREQPWDVVNLNDGRTIEGTLVEQRTDGTLQFKPRQSAEEMTISANLHHGVSFRRTAAQVAAAAANQALGAGDQRRTLEVMRWAVEKGAKDAALAGAGKWLKEHPGDREVIALCVPLWRERQDWAAMEASARSGVAADRNWSDGDELVVEALGKLGRSAELEAYAKQWLARAPTALRANLICGASFEAASDIRLARECFRKAWELGKSPDGALGFSRTSLVAGQFDDALRAGQALGDAGGAHAAEAKAYAGSAAAAAGNLALAKQLLTGFAPDGLPGPAAQAGAYALGLIAYREGRAAEAARIWSGVPTPAAQFALAIAQRREFSSADRLPAEGRAAARLLNATVRLENRQGPKALELIDQHLDGRHAFLFKVAQVLATGGSPESVRGLAAVRSPESQRWQLYGHVIAGRYDEADALARTLPAADGYVQAVRVFLAAARGDPEGARQLFQNSPGLPGAPAAYVARLAELYNTADDKVVAEPFDWPEGEVLASGWESSTPGTGIHVHAQAGRLVMDGTQTASEDPLTRAGVAVSGQRFRSARLTLDIANAAAATTGLELLDGAKRNGIAIGVRGGQARMHWRQLTNGKWTEWRELAAVVDGTTAVIAIDFSGGRIFSADPADPMRRQQLSDILAKSQGDWWLGVFGTAEAGAAWKVAFDDLRWRLKPEKGP